MCVCVFVGVFVARACIPVHTRSVLSVLRVWLDQYPEDFRTPQLQMHLFGLLEECRISPGQEFDDVYSLAEVLSAESSPTGN